MDTERFLGAAFDELSEENHFLVHFAHGNVEIFYSRADLRHFVQLVIVRREKRLCSGGRVVVYVLHHGPCDSYTVVSARAASDFVEQHQRAGRYVVQNIRRFEHLHHERGFALRNVVRRSHTGEYLVHYSYMGFGGGNETAYLRHEHDERGLPQQCALTRHVRSGYYDNLLLFVIQMHAVGNVLFPDVHKRLYDRMSSVLYIYFATVVELRTGVVPLSGNDGERQQHVDLGNGRRGRLQTRNHGAQILYELRVYARFDSQNTLLGAENLLLVLFELLCDVSFCVFERLLANPVGRHFVLVRVADFDVVSENVVVADFKRRDARELAFALLDFRQHAFAVGGYAAQIVQLQIHSVGYDAAFYYLVVRRVGIYLGCYFVAGLAAGIHAACKCCERLVSFDRI